MTRDEILNMEAGIIMDALVAEKIMGLPVIPFDTAPCPYCGDEMRFCGARSWCSTCHEWRYSAYKNYSDEIGAAWEVVELHKKVSVYFRGKYWFCDFDGLADYSYTQAETAPLAICRAALLAVTA